MRAESFEGDCFISVYSVSFPFMYMTLMLCGRIYTWE